MATFDSPLGNRKIQGQQIKEFNVPDESGYSFQENNDDDALEIEMQLRASKEAKKSGTKERLSEGARKRIEILIGMTKQIRSVEIESTVYVFQTLKSKDMRDIFTAVSEFDGTTQGLFELRRQVLARSLTHIGGLEFETFIGSNLLESKLTFIDELDNYLIGRLHDEYSILSKETDEKYAIKNDVEAKEVVEDLKK